MPRFERSLYDDAALFLALRDIARLAAGPAGDAELVTQSTYDSARAAAGHPNAPSAAQTARRFGIPRRALLARALAATDVNRFLGVARAEDDADWLREEDIVRSLRTVTSFLEARTLTPWGYDLAAYELLKRARRPWLHGTPLWLPTSDQVSSYAGRWAVALKLAGLDSTRGPGMRNGLPVVDALDLCINTHGTLPSRRQLETFAQANCFAVARRTEPWTTYVDQVTARRAARREQTPTMLPKGARHPDYATPFEHIIDDRSLPHAVKKRRSKPECIEWLIEFLLWLPPRLPPSSDIYKAFSEARPDAPWPRSFERHGGFTQLRKEAQRELGRRARAARPATPVPTRLRRTSSG